MFILVLKGVHADSTPRLLWKFSTFHWINAFSTIFFTHSTVLHSLCHILGDPGHHTEEAANLRQERENKDFKRFPDFIRWGTGIEFRCFPDGSAAIDIIIRKHTGWYWSCASALCKNNFPTKGVTYYTLLSDPELEHRKKI